MGKAYVGESESNINAMNDNFNFKEPKKKPLKKSKKSKDLARIKKSSLEIRKKLMVNRTPEERKMKVVFRDSGVKYEFQKIVFVNRFKFYVVDFYFEYNGIKLAVELDGYYHNTPSVMVKDYNRTKQIISKGIKIIRFMNTDVVNQPEYIVSQIKKKLNITNDQLSHIGNIKIIPEGLKGNGTIKEEEYDRVMGGRGKFKKYQNIKSRKRM